MKYMVELEVDSMACFTERRLVSMIDRIIYSGIELAVESEDTDDPDVAGVKQLSSVVVKKVVEC